MGCVVALACLQATARAQSVVANWQQKSTATPNAQPQTLGAGTAVNNDPTGSQVRVHVEGLQDNCYIKRIHVKGQRNALPDKDLQDLGPVDKLENRALPTGDKFDSEWINPPSNPSPFSGLFGIVSYQQTDVYAEVYLSCQVAGPPKSFRDVAEPSLTGIISVPDKKILEEASAAVSGSSVQAQGSASGNVGVPGIASANVSASGSASSSSASAVRMTRVFLDPEMHLEILTKDPLPPGWKLSMSPPTFTLNPGDDKTVDLMYEAPTPGMAIYYVRTTAKTPSGATYTTVSDARMLIVDKGPVDRHFSRVAVGDLTYKLLWASSTSSVEASSYASSSGLTLALKAARSGVLQLLVPKDVFGHASGFAASLDGASVAATTLATNALYEMVELPIKQGAASLVISSAAAGPPTTPARNHGCFSSCATGSDGVRYDFFAVMAVLLIAITRKRRRR